MWPWSLIAFGIFGGIILWELSTGLALDSNCRICHRRPEDPSRYWRIVGGQIASVLFILAAWYYLVR